MSIPSVYLFSLFFAGNIATQQDQMDSLLVVAKKNDNLEAVRAYQELARLSSDSFELHLQYARLGLALARKLNASLLEANILMNLGVLHDKFAHFEQAIAVSDDGIGMADMHEIIGTSFGYRLIDAFKAQPNAEIDIDASQGTTVHSVIKSFQEAA